MESNIVQNLAALKHLPSSWSIKTFDEIVKDVSGGNKKTLKSDFLDKGEFLIVDQGQSLIAGYTNNKELLVKAKPPYVVFGDHTRAFKYVDVPFAMGADGTKVLKPKIESILIEKYLYYFFLSLEIPNTGYNRHFKYLKELKIPLPPLAEQQKIAAILDAADSLRQKDQQLVERYTALSQSLFLEMFGDPVTNSMGWEINELEKLVKNDRSITYGILKPEENHDDGVIMLRIQDIKGSRVSLNKVHKVSQELSRQYKRTILEGNEIVISLVGTIGLTAKIPPELAQSNVHRNLGVIALNKEKIQTDFFFQYTLLGSFQTLIKKMTTGGNQPLLNLGALNTLGVIVPPLTLQNQFAERIQLIEAQKQQAQASLEKSEALFNSLLQRAFTGELTAKMAA